MRSRPPPQRVRPWTRRHFRSSRDTGQGPGIGNTGSSTPGGDCLWTRQGFGSCGGLVGRPGTKNPAEPHGTTLRVAPPITPGPKTPPSPTMARVFVGEEGVSDPEGALRGCRRIENAAVPHSVVGDEGVLGPGVPPAVGDEGVLNPVVVPAVGGRRGFGSW